VGGAAVADAAGGFVGSQSMVLGRVDIRLLVEGIESNTACEVIWRVGIDVEAVKQLISCNIGCWTGYALVIPLLLPRLPPKYPRDTSGRIRSVAFTVV
jgi:hypothetical protein